MSAGIYDDLIDFTEDVEFDEVDEAESFDPGEIDDMLDGMMDSAGEDYGERKRRKRKARPRRTPPKPVPTARGQSAYRPPSAAGGFVTQKQLQDALARVGGDVKRNAAGIKTINTRMTTLNARVDGVVAVNSTQSDAIGRLNRQMRVAGALELAQALTPGGIDAFQLLKGAAASGVLPDGRGALSNPWVIGGIGLILRNPAVLGGLTGGLTGQPGQPGLQAIPTTQ